MMSATMTLPARDLAPPPSISQDAVAFLAQASLARSAAPAFPPLDDLEAWTRLVADREAPFAAVMDAIIAMPGADLERRPVEKATVWVATPDVRTPGRPPVTYHIHGGSWVFGGGSITGAMTKMAALSSGGVVCGIDYRMAPLTPYPTSLDDCLAGYRSLLEAHSPADILVTGQSAGGNLAAAMMLRARDEGLPPPGALFLDTPCVDLTARSDSLYVNEGVDPVIGITELTGGFLYAGDHDRADPYLSPLHGDLSRGFPPTYLRTGTRDLLLSDTVRMHAKLRKAGVDADLYVGEGMPHAGFDMLNHSTPEDQDASADFWRWIEKRW